jgi:hypothetical protein
MRAQWNMRPGVTTRGTQSEWVLLVNGSIRTIRELILKVDVADSLTYFEGGRSRFLRNAENQLPNALHRILEEHDFL